MEWTLDDNTINGLFFCATLTGRRKGHAPFVQAGAETSDAGSEAEPDPCCPCWGHSGRVGADVGYESTESRNLGGSNLNTKQNYVVLAISNCKNV